MLDNTTAVACIQHMGTSHSDSCNELTFALWSWCMENNIWVSAAHIPGKDNVIADHESRHINMDAEWKLNSTLLSEAFQSLNIFPDTDLFASRLNSQLEKYVSYRPDPVAVVVDAFSLSWRDITFYTFPPFSVVSRVLQKVQQDEALGVLVVPDWPTQARYPVVQCLLAAPPVRLHCRKRRLQLPSQPDAVHPLIQRKRLHLLVCKICGRSTSKQE